MKRTGDGPTPDEPQEVNHPRVAHFDTHPPSFCSSRELTGLLSGPTAAEKKLKQLAELLDRSGDL